MLQKLIKIECILAQSICFQDKYTLLHMNKL
jgi:hypothetical protein